MFKLPYPKVYVFTIKLIIYSNIIFQILFLLFSILYDYNYMYYYLLYNIIEYNIITQSFIIQRKKKSEKNKE